MRAISRFTLIVAAAVWSAAMGLAVGVTAKSAVVVDAESGRVLWSKDPDTPRFPASTTKVMTALLVIDYCKPDDVITAPFDTESVTGSSLHLRPGEKLTAKELLYAIMLRSANDACHAAAIYISGGDAAFARLMNKRALGLGCKHTHFHNPHGLNDPEHTVSAHDLAIIACEAMREPLFREVVRCRKHLITRSLNQEDRWLINHNKWLWADKTADGIKTGYTVPAGHCYIGSATRKGFRIVTVLMNSENWQADNKALLEWAFHDHDQKVVAQAGSDMGEIPLAGGSRPEVRCVLGKDLKVVEASGENLDLKRTIMAAPKLTAPVKPGDKIGFVVFSDGSGWECRLPLLASESVGRPSIAQRAGSAGRTLLIALACVIGGSYLLKRLARKPRRTYGYFRAR